MNNKMLTVLAMAASAALFSSAFAQTPDAQLKWEPLFTQDGQYGENSSGWVVRDLRDISEPPRHPGATWEVKDKILYGTGRFGTNQKEWSPTWLLSARQYSNFVLETEFRFHGDEAWADGGVALRTPLAGDVAYDGLELQIADERYQRHGSPNTTYPNSLTGSFYLLQAPTKQVYRPGEWNRYRIEVREQLIKVWLNGELIQDVNLGLMTAPGLRHGPEGEEFLPTKSGAERPLKGHIGFEDESRHGTYIMLRNTRVAELELE